MTSVTHKRVVIAGGGFAGVRLARKLSNRADLDVTLISDRTYFAYHPQLYHAATGGSRSESAIPLNQLLPGLTIVKDSVETFDPKSKTVTTAGKQTIQYDFLVLALGTVTNYFGIKGLQEFSYDIKTIEGAEDFKRHLHLELIDNGKLEADYVVVGAGPTGVELAASLNQYLQRIAKLHGVAKPHYRVDLVEAAPRILPRSPEAVSARVRRRLEALGVRVMTGSVVEGETGKSLMLKGKTIKSQTVVWTAGVANHPFFSSNAERFKLAKNGRVEVDTHLQASNGVYVIGDNANTQFTGMAQTAIHDADYVAADIDRRLKRRLRTPYKPKKPISVIPVGYGWAAVEWGVVHIYGRIGWLLRRAADLLAYRDMEPLPQAIRVWLQEPKREDNCPICQNNG